MSVRRTVVGAAVALTLLPLGLLAFAWGYECWLTARCHAQMLALASRIDVTRLAAEGRRHHLELRLLDAAQPPLPAPVFEHALSASGQVLTMTLAVPRSDGRVLVLTRESRRGVRRLFPLRGELCKLALYQLLFTTVFAVVLAHGLTRPLERLASLVRRHPFVADDKLLRRNDEIGELARAVRRMADDLEARRRATAELGADVAHELKNPLATIAASAELVADHPERGALAAPHILASVARLRHSIDALLALLRLEESLPGEARVAVDYRSFVHSIVDEYRHHRLAFHVEAEVGLVQLVPSAWRSLLCNLIDNALMQPTSRREIEITAVRHGEVVVTRVRDFGPGISPGNRDKIFRRFYSLRPPGTPPGTGLGLSIVQAVAAAHGGAIRLEATEAGACFAIDLPQPVPDFSPEPPGDLHERAAG